MKTALSVSVLVILQLLKWSFATPCPDKSTLSCKDEGFRCPRNKPHPKMTYYHLDDGTKCRACQWCFESYNTCPNKSTLKSCWEREIPKGCKTIKAYSTYMRIPDEECDTCDIYACLK